MKFLLPLRSFRVLSICLGVSLLVIALWSGERASKREPAGAVPRDSGAVLKNSPNEPASVLEKASPASGVAVSTTASSSLAGAPHFQWLPSAQKAVREFTALSKKVFPTPEQQMRKSEILMNGEFVKNIGDYLLSAADPEMRNEAIDLIVEALKLGSEEANVQCERVIADSQVENLKLPFGLRKTLGETKGEILYQYTAIYPDKELQIPALLPGSVSQKIWANVKAMQEQNFNESKRELAESHR